MPVLFSEPLRMVLLGDLHPPLRLQRLELDRHLFLRRHPFVNPDPPLPASHHYSGNLILCFYYLVKDELLVLNLNEFI